MWYTGFVLRAILSIVLIVAGAIVCRHIIAGNVPVHIEISTVAMFGAVLVHELRVLRDLKVPLFGW